LDDPPIHIRPLFPRSAGANKENLFGSSSWQTFSIAPQSIDRNGHVTVIAVAI
jgi:hypothetical protein